MLPVLLLLRLKGPQLEAQVLWLQGICCPAGEDFPRSHSYRGGAGRASWAGVLLRYVITGRHLARLRLHGQLGGRGYACTPLLLCKQR